MGVYRVREWVGTWGTLVLCAVSGCFFLPDEGNDGNDGSADDVNHGDDDDPSDERMAGMLEAHNAVRASAQPEPDPSLSPLVWSEQLAADAMGWISRCNYSHDPALGNLNQGENLAASTAANDMTAETVVGLWAGEVSDYNYETNGCDDVCGHYTQIVWRDTQAVGCAVNVCPDGLENWDVGREIWSCRYSPPGNWIGERPY